MTSCEEALLVEVVRDWMARVMPGDEAAANAAVAAALNSFAGGASIAEACEEARRLTACWIRHPSRPRPRRPLAAAS